MGVRASRALGSVARGIRRSLNSIAPTADDRERNEKDEAFARRLDAAAKGLQVPLGGGAIGEAGAAKLERILVSLPN